MFCFDRKEHKTVRLEMVLIFHFQEMKKCRNESKCGYSELDQPSSTHAIDEYRSHASHAITSSISREAYENITRPWLTMTHMLK